MTHPLPPHRPISSARSQATWLFASLCGAVVFVSLLACQNGQMKPGISLETLNNGEAFDDIFSSKKTTKVERAPSAAANAAVQRGSGFFSPPEGWALISADDESGVYKLEHDKVESASIVISYDVLQNQGDGRLPELKTLHDAVITRLPESLVLQQSEVTRYKQEPRYHTMLRGKPSASSPELIVSGYTVALVQDAFTVFAAYPAEERTLSADVEALIYSLRAYAPLEQDKVDPPQEPDAPQPSGEEPSPNS